MEFLSVQSQISRTDALSEAIVAGENALDAKEEGFSAGLTTNLDVLNAQRDLSSNKTGYLQSRYDYILSMLKLEKVSGQLDEEDIKRVNSWLGLQGQGTAALEYRSVVDPAAASAELAKACPDFECDQLRW